MPRSKKRAPHGKLQYALSVLLVCAAVFTALWLSQKQTSAQPRTVLLDEIPPYSGEAYIEINSNVPFFTSDEITTDVFETYSELDSLGRCGVAYANICAELMPTEPRGKIGSVRPSGWHTVRYDGLVEGNYLYNRCHLIGYQLAGENANPENLITGTRYLNTIGMLPYENSVNDYVDETDNHVLYRVTPIFDGDNLVASGVLMEAYSVEDSGGLSFCIYCYNVQPGVTIDYATGESCLSDDVSGEYESTSVTTNPDTSATADTNLVSDDTIPAESVTTDTNETVYVSASGSKYHRADCRYVKDSAQALRLAEAQAAGYTACGTCKP